MQQVNITLHRFAELSEEAQQKVLDDNRQINVAFLDWYDFVYDDFCSLCTALGITLKRDDIYFKGFYAQDSSSAFKSVIDINALIKAIGTQAWKACPPHANMDIPPCPCDKRFVGLISKGIIDVYPETIHVRRTNSIAVNSHYSYRPGKCTYCHNIEMQCCRMEQWLETVVNLLNTHLFKSLQTEYEGLTADESVAYTIRSYNDLFTVDGENADHILALANPTR